MHDFWPPWTSASRLRLRLTRRLEESIEAFSVVSWAALTGEHSRNGCARGVRTLGRWHRCGETVSRTRCWWRPRSFLARGDPTGCGRRPEPCCGAKALIPADPRTRLRTRRSFGIDLDDVAGAPEQATVPGRHPRDAGARVRAVGTGCGRWDMVPAHVAGVAAVACELLERETRPNPVEGKR